MNTEQEIIANKELRRDIDDQLQKLKALPPSRERALARTKLEEAVMWLGMDLKRINELTPNCPDCKSNARVTKSPPESASRGAWFCPCNEPSTKPSGSGHFDVTEQCANPYPNSKDPSNTIIEPTADGLKL